MSFIKFDSDGYAFVTSISVEDPENWVESEFSHLNQFRDSEGNIRELTADEITARNRAVQSIALAIQQRDIRNAKLTDSDWAVTKALEAGEAVPSAWVTYRTALRNLPTHSNWPFLEDSDWPTEPS